MLVLWIGLALMVLGGVVASTLGRFPAASRWVGGLGVALGSGLVAIPLVGVLWGISGSSGPLQAVPWALPLGLGAIGLDGLSAFFGLLVVAVCGLSAIYGIGYLAHDDGHRRTAGTWLFFGLLEASMLGIVLARDGVVFLIMWEVMTLASFGLVVFDHHHAAVRRAGLVYLIAGHLGAACLFVMFLLLAHGDPGLAFDRFQAGPWANVCFILALVGFGTKAGFMPMHVWLPEAHSSAPSHVSAVMSGVMLKMGIYGLIRTIGFLGDPVPAWWGMSLAAIGGIGGVAGVLFALAQQDVKRILAYSSVENLGIIAMALGLGLVGRHLGNPAMEWLGFGGALLHSLNHALFKSMLFLGAGALLHSTGTRRLDMFGGLAKRLPALAGVFLVGSIAICGLPPLNGFVSEIMIYAGAWQSVGHDTTWVATMSVGVVLALALIGGLAVACFTRLYGVAFLGEPRTVEAQTAKPVSNLMVAPMALLALGCAVVGLGAPWAMVWLGLPLHSIGVQGSVPVAVASILTWTMLAGAGLVALIVVLWAVRRVAGSRYEKGTSGTWDCGYARPTNRMQYTGSSFAQPLTDMFSWALRSNTHKEVLTQPFPAESHFVSHTDDLFLYRVFGPLFRAADKVLSWGRIIQGGKVQVYILYILVTLILLLAYQMEG